MLRFILVFCFVGHLYAVNCTFSINDINYGSLNISSGGPFDLIGSISANCTAGGADKIVKVCVNLNAGLGGMAASGDPRYMLSGSNKGITKYEVPSAQGVFSRTMMLPSEACDSRSAEMGGRPMYLSKRSSPSRSSAEVAVDGYSNSSAS